LLRMASAGRCRQRRPATPQSFGAPPGGAAPSSTGRPASRARVTYPPAARV